MGRPLCSFRVVALSILACVSDANRHFVGIEFKENNAVTSQPTASAGPVGQAEGAPVVRRPATLFVAIGVAVVAALATIGSGIVMVAGGEELAIDIIAAVAGEDAEGVVNAMGGSALVGEAVETLNARGGMALVTGAGLLLFTLFMGRAAVWSRVLVTIFAALVLFVDLVVLGDEGTRLMQQPAALGGLAAIASFVLVWLPANNRYARRFKANR